MESKKPLSLGYHEREALHTVRKLIQRKPEVIPLLVQGMAKEHAVQVLRAQSKELREMFVVTQAFADACQKIAKEIPDEPPTPTQGETK